MSTKPDWWPKNPYPENIFPMPRERYLEIVPDPRTRSGLSGMLGRRFWDIASDAIWEAMMEEDAEALEWCRLHESEARCVCDKCGQAHDPKLVFGGIGGKSGNQDQDRMG